MCITEDIYFIFTELLLDSGTAGYSITEGGGGDCLLARKTRTSGVMME